MPPKKAADIFSKDIEFTLIDLIECRPILWDSTSELYKRADLKDATWEEVACSLGPNFSVSIVASRFKSMRDTFMSNLRRVKESKRSGKGTADMYIPKWYLYDRLKFLQKTLVQSASISNITTSSKKFDDCMSQTKQISSELLTQCLPEQEVIEEPPVLNIYYNDSMKKFMIQSTEESTDNFTDLSGSSVNVSTPVSTPIETTLQNLTSISTTSTSTKASISTTSTNSVFTSCSKVQDNGNQMYTKRGSAKRKNNDHLLMEEAVGAIKNLCQQDPLHSLESNSSTDSAHTLAMFIATRLREMMPDQRRQCENELLKLLSQF